MMSAEMGGSGLDYIVFPVGGILLAAFGVLVRFRNIDFLLVPEGKQVADRAGLRRFIGTTAILIGIATAPVGWLVAAFGERIVYYWLGVIIIWSFVSIVYSNFAYVKREGQHPKRAASKPRALRRQEARQAKRSGN
jgi:hypothetical protein